MKKLILQTLFVIFSLGLSAQTIDVNAPCLGATFTFTLDPTESPDASGRNVYFYEPASIEIQFNTELDRWEVRARGGNFDVYYHNDFASAPNPPDNMTSAWEDNAICDGTGLPTVTGDGTQDNLGGDPCAELGGDSDGDGVCDNNDLCPGEDDDLDQDNDNIPDACDDNPTIPDGVLVQAPCLDEDLPLILLASRVDETGRNVYINETYQIEVRYDADLARWEVTAEEPGEDVYFYNEFPSFPNPPTSADSPWTETGTICIGSSVSVTGTGTQDTLGCNLIIDDSSVLDASCPNEADGAVSIIVDGAANSVAYAVNGMPAATGNSEGLVPGIYELTVVDNAFPLMGQYLCSDTLSVEVFGEDVTPPVANCNPTAMVNLDDAGMGLLTPEAVDAVSSDACGTVSLSLDQEAFSCDDPDEVMVTLTVTDEAGLSASCTTLVMVVDAQGYCASTPVRDLFGGRTDLARLPLAPNPAQDQVQIDLSGIEIGAAQQVTLSVFNSLGQQLQTHRLDRFRSGNFSLNTSDLASGVFHLRLDLDSQPKASARLVIAKN